MANNMNTTKGIASPGMSEEEIDLVSTKAGEELAKAEKVALHIPLTEGNKDDETVECCINGYNYIIKRGQTVKVPLPIVEILKSAGLI